MHDKIYGPGPDDYGRNPRPKSVKLSKYDPDHYTRIEPESKDVIRQWKLNYFLGCAVKYISRAGHKKGVSALDDILKAKHYLEFEIEYLEHEYDETLEELRQSDDSSAESTDNGDNSTDYFGTKD